MSNSGNTRTYREPSYQQPRNEDNNNGNQQPRWSNNYATGNGNRGRRGAGPYSYRGGTQSDAGTGGKLRTD